MLLKRGRWHDLRVYGRDRKRLDLAVDLNHQASLAKFNRKPAGDFAVSANPSQFALLAQRASYCHLPDIPLESST
jgi:hypothetical protein